MEALHAHTNSCSLRTLLATRFVVEVVEIIENSHSLQVKSAKHVKCAWRCFALFSHFFQLSPSPREPTRESSEGRARGGRWSNLLRSLSRSTSSSSTTPGPCFCFSKKKAQVDGHLIQQKQKLAFANNTPPLLPHHHPDNFQPPKTLFKMLISKENRRAIYESLFKGEQPGLFPGRFCLAGNADVVSGRIACLAGSQ